MNKINKNCIERIKVKDKDRVWKYEYWKPVKKTLFRKELPERWGIPFCKKETREEIEKGGLLRIIDNKVYRSPCVIITMVSGVEIKHRFDTYKEAEKYAHEYIKRNDLKDFINTYNY